MRCFMMCGQARNVHRVTPPKKGRAWRPRMEMLEDRLCLSSYILSDLGQRDPHIWSFHGLEGVNDSGQVAATLHTFQANLQFGKQQAYLYDCGTRQLLPDTLGGDYSLGRGLNNLGHVVGDATVTPGNPIEGKLLATVRAFLYRDGAMQDLGTLDGIAGPSLSYARGINDRDQVVGFSDLRFGEHDDAFLWTPGGTDGVPANPQMKDLGNFGDRSEANAINDRGEVVGYRDTTDGIVMAFIYDASTDTRIRPLANVPGGGPGDYSEAFGINESGQIVGAYRIHRQPAHAFLWNNGTVSELPFSYAYGINNLGQVVGKQELPALSSHAVLYSAGSTIDLNDLFPSSGWTLLTALDINDAGQIVAEGRNLTVDPTGNTHTLLLTPVPDLGDFELSDIPETVTAGEPFTATLTAVDTCGNVNPDYTGTVHFASSDPEAGLPADFTFTPDTHGVITFEAMLRTVRNPITFEKSQTITVTDTADGLLTDSVAIQVLPAPVARFLVQLSSPTTIAGDSLSVQVTPKDEFGNVAVYHGTIHFSSSDPQAILPDDVTSDEDGFVALSTTVRFKTVADPATGVQFIQVTDTSDPNITGFDAAIVQPGPVARFEVELSAPTTIAGDSLSVNVTPKDEFGNDATYHGAVHFSSSDPQAILPDDITSDEHGFVVLSTGIRFKTVMNPETGTADQVLTVTDTVDPSITGEDFIFVQPAAAARFRVSLPRETTAGVEFNCVLEALDRFDNLATDYTGTVNFTSSSLDPELPADYTFTSDDQGQHAFVASLKHRSNRLELESIESIMVADGTITGFGLTDLHPGPASQILVILLGQVPGEEASVATAGVGFLNDIRVRDRFGNYAVDYTGTLNFTSSDPRAELPADHTFSGADLGFYQYSVTLKTAFNEVIQRHVQNVTATDTSDASLTGTGWVRVEPGPAASFVVTVPRAAIAGEFVEFGVEAYDRFLNFASNYAGTVDFSSSDPLAILPAAYTFTSADEGQHNFQAMLNTPGIQAIDVADFADSSIRGSGEVDVEATTVSIANAIDGRNVVLTAGPGTRLADVSAVANPSPGDFPPGLSAPVGFFSFQVHGLVPGGAATVTLTLPSSVQVTDYYKYGATIDNPLPHWYRFLFDGLTGAEIHENVITLHFIDGQRGDNDLSSNGIIVDPGAPALSAARPPQLRTIVLNDGSPQRSMINSITVTFSDLMTFDPGAFELQRQGGGPVRLRLAASVVDDQTVAVLTFRGKQIIGGSLADGSYTLTVHGSKVHDGHGRALPGDHTEAFFRLFGDADGDGDVDVYDRRTFNQARKNRAYFWYLDYDGDDYLNSRIDRHEVLRRLKGRG